MNQEPESLLRRVVSFSLGARPVVLLLLALVVAAGLRVLPFSLPSPLAEVVEVLGPDPLPIDALPDIGENQQIVFTEWPGRSPEDVEDQVTYPLTTALLGVAGVRAVRSASAFGFSSIYVIFEEDVEFYWSRSRVLEKLSSLPQGTLPAEVAPTLGPDATALGQVYWYTLEGQDAEGNTVGGWDQHELRTLQDYTVRYALQGVEGVSEVASIGGHVTEFQVDVDPDALQAHGLTLAQVARALRRSNIDIGARTMELNGVEYVVRGLGAIEDLRELEELTVASRDGVPLRLREVAQVHRGPAHRRGGLDDAGAPTVGGVVVSRFGENPAAVIAAVQARIDELGPGMPRRTLDDGTEAQVRIVPFYDRGELIAETAATLRDALWQQLLITAVVILVMLRNLRSAALVTLLLPLGVLLALVAMRFLGVSANIMALGGVAIAIGTMVDVGIVLVENIHQHLGAGTSENDPDGLSKAERLRRALLEVAPAVMTSVATTVISFLPIFGLQSSELRLFGPLAQTKTLAMAAALVVGVFFLPALAMMMLRRGGTKARWHRWLRWGAVALLLAMLGIDWMPLGEHLGALANVLFVALVAGGLLGGFVLFERVYPALLRAFLTHKKRFFLLPGLMVLWGTVAFVGAAPLMPDSLRQSQPGRALSETFPGLSRQYMPAFDEGAFLYMPTTLPHASVGEVQRMLSNLDAAIAAIPEVDRVVGKWGRAESPLDPAPASMIETIITYHAEYGEDADGRRVRQWRDHIQRPEDIWEEIVAAAEHPGVTGAPILMPMSARIVMLQSGMRAPLGVRVQGSDRETVEAFALELESALRAMPEVRPETVFAERLGQKGYLEIDIDREAIGRYGLHIDDVQQVLRTALGGVTETEVSVGRERYPVRLRYMREERDSIEALRRVVIEGPEAAVPLEAVAQVNYVRGPQVIKSEDTFATSYVFFDRAAGQSEGDAAEAVEARLGAMVERGELAVPAGVRHSLAGTYQHQLRSEARLRVLLPLALVLVVILLYLQFRRMAAVGIIFSGVAVAMSGAFVMLWLYAQPWFLNLGLFGVELREVFRVGEVPLTMAVWVGMIALVGIATDDGVVMTSYLEQQRGDGIEAIRAGVLEAGKRRLRPCLMTSATTILALLPVISSHGRGADVMAPMALPAVGGMAIALLTLFVVPVLHSAWAEARLGR